MDKIDMSLDDIIKQNRKENRKLAVQKKKATAGLKQRPSGPAGQKRPKRPGLVKGGLQVKGQLKQFRARIGGKKNVGKGAALQKKRGAARLQQQGGAVTNRAPARKVGKQRLPVKKTAGAQVVNRNRKQQQQVQQRVQQGKAARQQQFNQRRGIQTIQQGGGRKNVRLNRQNFANTQTNRQQQINRQETNTQQQQLSRRQRQKNKRLLQNQPAPRANLARPQRQNNPRLKAPKVRQPRVNTQGVNPKLLTVSISNPRAMQNSKPVKINRNKPKMQISGGTLNDRFGQLQQPRNVPNTNQQRRRRNQQGRGQNNSGRGQNNSGRTVLLV
ncbi:UAP56-interacting factor-like [Patiria miniata]|uniref:Uncharacterized protein n=1 Tax=Patiria miniata TaxID=46514 RepID=A0A913ZHE1_PATMI|nr:UAP56-interacting factor-like [Patiria miniata]